MAEGADPSDDVRLSPYERLALWGIEAELRRDRRFARRMGAPPARGWLGLSVALLGVASVFLMVVGIRTSDPVVLWCLAAVWPLTLVQGIRLLCHPGRDGRPRNRYRRCG
ncbi:DUF3040 domain-containing protein [Streptomyces humi]|uniref:DUF3040 domain-containing protein n=1 Tax=Streptomyces humi TaxID=1428620 RepID=UPI0006289544|nr:DUF3040 domain-containing protein [Streptomyces humi]